MTQTLPMSEASYTLDDLPGVLQIPGLWDHQRRSIEASVSGHDVLLISATGSGKSEAFLGVGLMCGGVTLVISPLRSLIADHHRRLQTLGLPVRIWNSDVRDKYKRETLGLLNTNWTGFIYTTPESLKARDLSMALTGRVNLAVVDEAHCCLKDRGFRMSYAWLGKTIERLVPQSRFACTATLPAADRAALIRTLRLQNPTIITIPVARSNLTIRIVSRDPDTLTVIMDEHHGQAGIIFSATVATAKRLYAELIGGGRNVGLYHGRLPAKAKQESQAAFMSGETPVMVATDAFLLGIDKADLRFIVHYDHPKSVEDWAQGFGRAGRDGLPATVYGAFAGSTEGRDSRQFLLNASYPSLDDLRAVWDYLISAPWHDLTQGEIGEKALGYGGKYSGGACLNTLQRYKLADASPHPTDRRRKLYAGKGDFDGVNWKPYTNEGERCQARFAEFCGLVMLPESEIPTAIDRYFGAA